MKPGGVAVRSRSAEGGQQASCVKQGRVSWWQAVALSLLAQVVSEDLSEDFDDLKIPVLVYSHFYSLQLKIW